MIFVYLPLFFQDVKKLEDEKGHWIKIIAAQVARQ